MIQPKLRDARRLAPEPYPVNRLPREHITQIGAGIVFLLHTGRKDMGGDDWGDIFARAIGGTHLSSPVGIADVVCDKMAWSMKTVKNRDPHAADSVRLISGRCSPDFSFGILDPHEDVQKTGEAVLAIWNSRVDIAMSHYPRVRVAVLLRDEDLSQFTLYEEYLEHFNLADYEWRENPKGNLWGYHRRTGAHQFVWQPHGSQFTILSPVPADATRFRVRHPEPLSREETLRGIGFDETWVEIM